MKKLFLIPLEPIIGGEGKHILPHPSKTDNIFKYLDIIDLLSSVAQISTEITNQICYLTEISSLRMFQSVSFGSLAHAESLIINRFGVLPRFITSTHFRDEPTACLISMEQPQICSRGCNSTLSQFSIRGRHMEDMSLG